MILWGGSHVRLFGQRGLPCARTLKPITAAPEASAGYVDSDPAGARMITRRNSSVLSFERRDDRPTEFERRP
jgi:hypothetical protein